VPWPGCVAGLPDGPNRPRFPPARHAGGRRPRPWVVVVGGGHPGELTHRPTRLPAAAWLPGPGPARQTRPGSAVARAGSVSHPVCTSVVRPAWSSRRRAVSSGWPRTSGTRAVSSIASRIHRLTLSSGTAVRSSGPCSAASARPLASSTSDVCATRSGAPDGAAAPTHTPGEKQPGDQHHSNPTPDMPDSANPGSAAPDSADPGRGTPKPVAPCLVPRWGSVADAEPERAGLSTGPPAGRDPGPGAAARDPGRAPSPVTPAGRRRP
jgi:hypothetical protein